MAYTLTNLITRFRHKGLKSELEICQLCGLMIVNDSLFPFGFCTGTSKQPHGPHAAVKA